MQVAHVPRRRGNHFECEPSDTESQFGGGGLLRDADGMGRPRRPRRRPVKWRARTAQPSGKSTGPPWPVDAAEEKKQLCKR